MEGVVRVGFEAAFEVAFFTRLIGAIVVCESPSSTCERFLLPVEEYDFTEHVGDGERPPCLGASRLELGASFAVDARSDEVEGAASVHTFGGTERDPAEEGVGVGEPSMFADMASELSLLGAAGSGCRSWWEQTAAIFAVPRAS